MEATAKTYENLKALLDKESFPKPYVFKFIVVSESETEMEVRECFDGKCKIKLTYSKSKKYTTLSILKTMPSSQAIIDKYLLVSKVKNVIHL